MKEVLRLFWERRRRRAFLRLIRRRGAFSGARRWRLLLLIVAIYLVRDLFLYVFLPFLIWLKAR